MEDVNNEILSTEMRKSRRIKMDKKFLEDCLNKGMSTRDIEKICNKHRNTISYWIHKYGLDENMKYKKNEKFIFEKIDTKEKAYVLGFILADAGITHTNVELSVSLNDKEVIEFVAETINSNVIYDYTFDKKTRRFPRARTQKRIYDIKKFTGGEAKIERHYPRIREDLEKYLIQGFFDGDGCITWGRRKDKNRIWQKICFNSQLKILEGVQKYLINKLHIATTIRPKGKEHCYVLEFANRDDVMKFCEHIYSDNDFIILKRKYFKYKALRLELEENGESLSKEQYRAEPAEQEGVETSGDIAIYLNNHNSIQDYKNIIKR